MTQAFDPIRKLFETTQRRGVTLSAGAGAYTVPAFFDEVEVDVSGGSLGGSINVSNRALGGTISIKDLKGLSENTPINVTGGSIPIEDPNSPGSFVTGTVAIKSAGATCVWRYDGTQLALVSSSAGGGGGTGGGTVKALTHASTAYTTASTDVLVEVDVSGGALVGAITLANKAIGGTVTIKDSKGLAENTNIGVTAGTVPIEDPNAPGTISAGTKNIKVGGATVTWMYDGTNWVLVGSFVPPAGAGVQTVASLTHASSAYTTAVTDVMVEVDVSGGALAAAITLANRDIGSAITVKDLKALAEVTNIGVTGGSVPIEDPNNPGTIAAGTVNIKVAGAAVTWIYDGTSFVLAGGFGPGTPTVAALTHASTAYTTVATDTLVTCDVSGGALAGAVTLANRSIGSQITVKDAKALSATTPIGVTGGSIPLEDPNNVGTLVTGTVYIKTAGAAPTWLYDGTQFWLVGGA